MRLMALALSASVAWSMPPDTLLALDLRTGRMVVWLEPAKVAKLRTYYAVIRPGQSPVYRLEAQLNWRPAGRADGMRLTHRRPLFIAVGDSFGVQVSVADSVGRWSDKRAAWRAR